MYLVESGSFLEGMGTSARSLVVLLGRRALAPMRVVREVLWMPLGRYKPRCHSSHGGRVKVYGVPAKFSTWPAAFRKFLSHHRSKCGFIINARKNCCGRDRYRYSYRGFVRKGARVLGLNIITVPHLLYGLKRCSGTFGSILDLNNTQARPSVSLRVTHCGA
jgi:hypothetical protein